RSDPLPHHPFFPTRRSSDLLFCRLLLSCLLLTSTTGAARAASSEVNSSPEQLIKTLWQAFSHPAGQAADVRQLISLFHPSAVIRSEEHTSELQSRENLVCRL